MTTLTTATQRLIDYAETLGLRPVITPPKQGAIPVILSGQGTEAGYGVIYVGAHTGKVTRMYLRLGNNDQRPTAQITHTGQRACMAYLRNTYATYVRCLPTPEPPHQPMTITSGRATWGHTRAA